MLNIDFNTLRDEWESAPRGFKRSVIEKAAMLADVSPDTIYREFRKRYGKCKTVKREKQVDGALIDEVADLKLKGMGMSLEERELSTEQCINFLIRKGRPGAKDLTVSTVNRRLAEKGFRVRDPKIRYEAQFANHEAQMDFSRSKYFQVWKPDGKGGYILKASKRELHYKKGDNRFRLWLVQYIDSFSRLRLAKGYGATGESAIMGIDFLDFVWMREEDDHPLRYLPHIFKTDNGAFEKRKEVREMLDALGIERRRSRPHNKDSQQKVETSWKVLWRRFELPLVLQLSDAGIETISMQDYNELLHDHLTNEQELAHPLRSRARGSVYRQSILQYPPKSVDVDLKEIACRTHERRVPQDLMVKFKGGLYEAPVYAMDKPIRVYMNMAGELMGELIEEDRKPFLLQEFRVRDFDDFEHRHKPTYRQQREQILKEKKKVKQAAKKDRNQVGKETFLKPKPESVKPDSPFIPRQAAAEFASVYEAKVYIGSKLPTGENYATYAHVFDGLLNETLSRRDIDEVLSAIKPQRLTLLG